MNKKIIIGVIVVIIIAIIGVLFFLGSSNLIIPAGESQITLPSQYTIDDKGIAYNGDIGIYFTSVVGSSPKDQIKFFNTIKSNGKDAGYKNVTTKKIKGYKTYQYSANPKELKEVSSDRQASGNYETWKEYKPYTPFTDITDMDVVSFRCIEYVNKDSKDICDLYIFTNNTDVDLYSPDMQKIVNSIAPNEAG